MTPKPSCPVSGDGNSEYQDLLTTHPAWLGAGRSSARAMPRCERLRLAASRLHRRPPSIDGSTDDAECISPEKFFISRGAPTPIALYETEILPLGGPHR